MSRTLKLFSAIGLIGLSALNAAPIWNCENIRQLEPGKLSIRAAGGTILLDEDFSAPNANWKEHIIFDTFTRITHKFLNGTPCLYIERNPDRVTKPGEKFDTAWQLTTVTMQLPKDARTYVLNLKVQCTNDRMKNCWGHGDAYRNQIVWLGKDGKPLGIKSHFKFNIAPNSFAETLAEGDIPQDATAAFLTLGADLPDLEPGQFVAFSKATLQILPSNPIYKPQALFTTSAIPVQKGKVTIKGTETAASRIEYQVASTSDIHGAKENWTPFRGPNGSSTQWYANGSALPAFPANDVFLRLRVRLTGNTKEAPIVTGLTVGNYSDSNLDPETLLARPHAVRISQSPVQNASLPFRMKLIGSDYFVPSIVKLLVNDKDAIADVKNEKDICIVTPRNGFQQGLNFITVEMEDSHGTRATEDLIHYVGEVRKTGVVTLRDDGMTLIDGKPFFPIGMACVGKDQLNGRSYDTLFKMFHDCGMNIARHYSSYNMTVADYPEFIAAAEKYGIKLYMAASTNGACDKDIRRVAQSIVKQIGQPHIAWDIGDDTSAFVTPSEMENRYQTCTAIDPTRLTIQEDGVGAIEKPTYTPYAPFTEVFAPEIYPFHSSDANRDKTAVPIFISSMKKIKKAWEITGCPARTAWPLIQYFYNCADDDRLPTPEELRAMTYLCIIHGAQGIVWYRYGGYRQNAPIGFKQEEWNVVANQAKELRSLYDVLCDRATTWQPTVTVTAGRPTDELGNASVSALLKGTGSQKWLFTASSVHEKTIAQITVPAGTKSVTEYFSQRKAAIVNGTITAEFAPLGVQVFVLE